VNMAQVARVAGVGGSGEPGSGRGGDRGRGWRPTAAQTACPSHPRVPTSATAWNSTPMRRPVRVPPATGGPLTVTGCWRPRPDMHHVAIWHTGAGVGPEGRTANVTVTITWP